MALISTLPNFFTQTRPIATDFNAAAKAIIGQIGGVYWDDVQGAYLQMPGNIDTTNLVSGANFQNYQKAEPSYTFLWNAKVRQNSAIFNDTAIFGPVPFDVLVMGFGLLSFNANSWYYIGGMIDVYLNGRPFQTVQLSTVAGAVTDSAYVRFNLPMRPGDWLFFDLSGTQSPNGPVALATSARVTGTPPVPHVPNADAAITLYCKAYDVRM